MPKRRPIVGVWFVRIYGAPFEHHMLTFHADGTLLQANPDAGDAVTSDSVGMGLWQASDEEIQAKFVEITASRETHDFVARGEITLKLCLTGDIVNGTASAIFYDAHNNIVNGPTHETLKGWRITLETPTPVELT